MTHAELAELGGVEGAEVIMWLVMRGALSPQLRRLHRSYYLPSMTAIATAIYEDASDVRYPPVTPAGRRRCASSPASSGSRAAIRSRSSAASAPIA